MLLALPRRAPSPHSTEGFIKDHILHKAADGSNGHLKPRSPAVELVGLGRLLPWLGVGPRDENHWGTRGRMPRLEAGPRLNWAVLAACEVMKHFQSTYDIFF